MRGALFLHQMLHTLPHNVVMEIAAFQCGFIRATFGGAEYGKRGLGKDFAIARNPCQRIIIVRGAEIDQRAFLCIGLLRNRLSGEHDVGHILDGLLQFRIVLDRVLPNLECV